MARFIWVRKVLATGCNAQFFSTNGTAEPVKELPFFVFDGGGGALPMTTTAPRERYSAFLMKNGQKQKSPADT
jgi:hypothetical protein